MSPSAHNPTPEQADLARERKELSEDPEAELEELAQIYVKPGLDQSLARQVAHQLMGVRSGREQAVQMFCAPQPE